MLLINCEVNLILTWSAGCAIIYTDVANQIPTFTITEKSLMFQFLLYQNYYLAYNYNRILKEQSVGINIYQNQYY